ncbi:hypothetical protein Taro_030643 [Colocasia esculenta]|uniref:Uncharacterized protein n=1 Tax=Colocasia esculenta TaxID=4460 RepID=A0A843VPP9_COLES|nr:hypothetical protein [Colocasia esculenta]
MTANQKLVRHTPKSQYNGKLPLQGYITAGGRSYNTTSTEHSFTSTSEKASTQRTTRNEYPQRVQVPTSTRYHHRTTNTTVPPPGHTTTISTSDNTTQELPLSLAVKDERSNCRSITAVKLRTVETNQHHNL